MVATQPNTVDTDLRYQGKMGNGKKMGTYANPYNRLFCPQPIIRTKNLVKPSVAPRLAFCRQKEELINNNVAVVKKYYTLPAKIPAMGC